MTKLSIGIIVFDGVLTSEVVGPAEVFALAGQDESLDIKVLLIGLSDSLTITTNENLRLGVDTSIVKNPRVDVLLVPGGSDMDMLFKDKALHTFIQQHDKQEAWLGSVCSGAFVLAEAGVLNGRQATTYFGGGESLQAQYPEVKVQTNQTVVIDRRYLTADGGLLSYQAALTLLGRLTSPENAKCVYDTLGLARLGTWPVLKASMVA